MPNSQLQRIAALSSDQKVALYLAFLHQLTIVGREIWADTDATPAQMVERFKWANEITHRVVNRLRSLHNNNDIHTDEDTWNSVLNHASQVPGFRRIIEVCMDKAFEIVGVQ